MIPICDLCKKKIDDVQRKYYAIGPLRYTGEWATMCRSCHSLYGQFEHTALFRLEDLNQSKRFLGYTHWPLSNLF